MNSDDRKKLLDAGFRILRTDSDNKTIKELGKTGWIHLSKHNTIAEANRALAMLLQDPKTIHE